MDWTWAIPVVCTNLVQTLEQIRPQNAEVRHAARDPPLDAPWRLLRAEAIGMRERLRAAS
jgi:hypothetical protein